jgi:hypothetical protein
MYYSELPKYTTTYIVPAIPNERTGEGYTGGTEANEWGG